MVKLTSGSCQCSRDFIEKDDNGEEWGRNKGVKLWNKSSFNALYKIWEWKTKRQSFEISKTNIMAIISFSA